MFSTDPYDLPPSERIDREQYRTDPDERWSDSVKSELSDWQQTKNLNADDIEWISRKLRNEFDAVPQYDWWTCGEIINRAKRFGLSDLAREMWRDMI